MMKLVKNLLAALGFLVVAMPVLTEVDKMLFRQFGYGADSTDGVHRSGMAWHKDAETGCEYLASPWGGLTPRLDPTGKHICRIIGRR